MEYIEYSAATLVGQRENNQDGYAANAMLSCPNVCDIQFSTGTRDIHELNVFAVCDGVGSFAQSGDAAHAALQRLYEERERYLQMNEQERPLLSDWVAYALDSAQKSLKDYCSQHDAQGSATMTILAVAGDGEYVFGNIGDSPAYLLRKKQRLVELSERHNLAAEKRRRGEKPSPDDSCALLHHLGETGRNSLTAHWVSGTLEEGDALLLCSDGVSNTLSERKLASLLKKGANAIAFAEPAAAAPGADNCTAIVVRIG